MLLYFIIGCCIGSFLCLTAQRIPLGYSIIYPRSHCVKCCRSLSWYELIPILSIIVQRFRCRYCRCRLPFYYLLAEALCGGLFVWFFTFSSARNYSTFIWVLSALLFSLMDLFYFMVHSHTLFCSWAILWIFWLQAGVFQWQSVLLTFIVGGVCLRYGQSYLGAAGDTLLMLSWSGGLSLEELLQILFLASLFGISVFSVYFICHKKKMEKLPFIPFLSSALLIVLHLRY
ncbi:peptidase A24 [Enterococcus faecium]|uniref:prepilin peptidase n=1 Tax=Enterococcus faecium TaxID=1352 RepID=UPI000B3E6DF5|nr:A24 family peptidase [Enterococcus faecium]OUZ29018.1 peptidase A24 [Enterococcus faecium]